MPQADQELIGAIAYALRRGHADGRTVCPRRRTAGARRLDILTPFDRKSIGPGTQPRGLFYPWTPQVYGRRFQPAALMERPANTYPECFSML